MEGILLRDGREHRIPRDDVRELRPVGTTWAIGVKILRLWSELLENGESCMRVVVSDKEGNKIGGTIPPQLVERFRDTLVEGEWRFIMTLEIVPSNSVPKLSNHRFEFKFQRTTQVRFITPISTNYFLNHPKFEDMLKGRVQYSVLTDVLGFISAVGHLRIEHPAMRNEEPYTLSFMLTDERDEVIECTAYGSIARMFHDQLKMETVRRMVCVLRFWTLEKEIGTEYTKTVCVSTSGCSQFMLNPWIREAIEFRGRYMRMTDRGSVIDP